MDRMMSEPVVEIDLINSLLKRIKQMKPRLLRPYVFDPRVLVDGRG